ncbi:MAG TPA: hypothetical protein VL400_07070 [Polyangiaceae bacterium]|nr:hypothetical protein [Polyangiaceae bacterium]
MILFITAECLSRRDIDIQGMVIMRGPSATVHTHSLHVLALRLFAAGALAALATLSLTATDVDAAPSETARAIDKSRTEADNYTAEMKPEGNYTVGKEGTVEVVVTARGDYHLNPQFPIKFTVGAAADGLAFPKVVLKRDDGKFDEHGGSFHVPFTAARAGKFSVSGTMSISVCNEKRCLMEKVPLDLEVTVQ